MGNAHIKPHPRQRNKKQVHWRAAARPQAPGKPVLVTEGESTPDLVTIRWNKPISDGGSPVSGYLVEHRRTGSPHWVRATPLVIQTTELTISGLEPGWRYQFKVRAENAVGLSDPSELSEPITVTLQRSAVTSPRITQELQDTVALENEKAEFVVHFLGQPAPKICWYKDAFEIFSSRRIRILTEPDRSVLTIHQCSLSDEGEIKCTATNRAGHVSTKAALTVNAPPSIRLPRQYEDGLLFEIGELIRLKVSVAGRPTPLVFWTHNGESIKNNERYELEYVDNSSVLKINDAQRTDRGEYIIKAVNKLGEDTQSFLVTVTDKPSPPGKARVVMALGRTVTLSWSTPTDDGGCKIGNYIVEYYRLGWDMWLKAATSRQLTTMLGDLIEGSEYKFRIKAESPYGVSEPSEESETIFIPDPKRGIVQPPGRSRSQPRDIDHKVVTPMARRKNKRPSSSQRPENEDVIPATNSPELNNTPPKRPMRTKIKSPSKTPEASPFPSRRDLDNPSSPPSKRDLETKLNKEIFERSDRTSMARELSYGSPLKKDLLPVSSFSSNMSSTSEKSRTPSPTKVNDLAVFTVKIESPPGEVVKKPAPASPEMRKLRISRENSENLTGSSEFMLVLYPDEDQKGPSDFDFGENSVPPPMSLSAPELGADSPIFNSLRTSASSSELLHERAMNRLYEAAKAEEKELERRRKSIGVNIEIPTIKINSKDQEKLELERLHSINRRLSGGTAKELLLRRHSLKSEGIDDLVNKSNLTWAEKKAIMMNRQRSDSEEMEEKVFEKLRSKMALEKQSSTDKRQIRIVDEEKWADDYVSSTEESSVEDEEEGMQRNNRKFSYYDDNEEEHTYHPGGMTLTDYSDKDPFEILTKRKDPPSPDFIPKPILKKTDHEEEFQPPSSPKSKTRSHSPIPPNIFKRNRTISLAEASLNLPLLQKTIPEEVPSNVRPRSSSLIPQDDMFVKTSIESQAIKPRKRAFSLLPQAELFQKSLTEEKPISTRQRSFSLIPAEEVTGVPISTRQRSFSLIPAEEVTGVTPEAMYNSEPPKMSFLMQTISAAATISGITAASIVIPDRLIEKQKDEEEAKVVIDHYGDIVRNYSNKRKNSFTHKSRESLQSRESLPSVEESNEELSSSFEDKQFRNFRNAPANNYHDPYYSYRQSEVNKQNSMINSSDDPYSSYKTHSSSSKETNRESKSLDNTEACIIQKSALSPPLSKSDTSKETLNDPSSLTFKELDPSNRRSFSPTPIHIENKSSSSVTQPNRTKITSALYTKEEIQKLSTGGSLPSRKVSSSPLRKPEKRRSVSPYASNRTSVVSSPREDRSGGYQDSAPLRRKASPSPLRKRKTEPSPMRLKPPKLKEIMTQTSESLASFDADSGYSLQSQKQGELTAKVEVKVHRFFDYVTDLVMFMVACWLYLFKNELLAIPVLLVLVYRQLQIEITKRIPQWLVRLLRRKKKTS